MLRDFRTKFPEVPGDVSALERCCDELTDRAAKIRDRADTISSAISRISGWAGKAREAFESSYEQEKRELTIWDSGTDEAAASLRRYTTVLEAELRVINEIRAQADELWKQYCLLSDTERAQEERFYASTVASMTLRYNEAVDGINEQAAVTAAELRAALYFTPEHIKKNADGTTIDVGKTQPLTKYQIKRILASLADPAKPLMDLAQGSVGNCHLLASLEAYDRTPEGRAHLASLITTHHGANGTVDGFLVRFPGLNNGAPILVKEVLQHGNKKLGGGLDVASIFEMAYVKAHRGGTKSAFWSRGSSGSFAIMTMKQISGQPSSFHADFLWGKKRAQQAAINAVRDGQPVVAEALPRWVTPSNDIAVTVDGKPTTIMLADRHVYTVIGADEHGVTLLNPWGKNNAPSGSTVGPVFTMSWKDFHAQFGDITVGATPWTK